MNEFVKKLIERLEEQKGNPDAYCLEGEKRLVRHWNVCIDNAIEIVNELAEEYNNGWIPCSERLPEENGWYLVTNELGVVHQQRWGANHWQKLRDEAVIAWQPLPEPYKPKEQPDSISEAWKQQTMSRFERVE